MRRFILALPLVVFGCAHQQQTKKDPAPIAKAEPAPPPAAPEAAATPACTADTQCGDKQLCVRGQCVDITADLAECNQLRVHFTLDSDQIEDGDRDSLVRSARCLRADHSLHVTVEGNADERGTEEYNMALGDRRATAVAKYLTHLGVSKTQLRTVSYGKEKPLCTEHDEECWAQNRRAELQAKQASIGKHHR